MSNKRHKPEEIVTKLRQVEVLVGQGMARIDAIREIGVVEQTYYRWRKLYGGMGRCPPLYRVHFQACQYASLSSASRRISNVLLPL